MPQKPAAPTPRVKLLLVESSPPLQAVLTRLLRDVAGVELVGSVDTAAGALAAFDEQRPDVVVLDLVLGEGNGLDLLQTIRLRAPSCQVWVFTGHDGEPYRRRCREAGADRFFSKYGQHQQLIEHLRALGGVAPLAFPQPEHGTHASPGDGLKRESNPILPCNSRPPFPLRATS